MRTRTLVLTAALLLPAVGAACARDSGLVSSGGAIGSIVATSTAPGLTNEDLAALKATRDATSFQVDIEGFGAGPESLIYNAPDSYQSNNSNRPVLVVHGTQYERMRATTEFDDPDAYFPAPLPQPPSFLVLLEPGNISIGPVKIVKVKSDGNYATEVAVETFSLTVTLRFSKFGQVPSIAAPSKIIPVTPSPDCAGPDCPIQIETSLPTPR